jgi:hypothetical protein
MKLSLIAVTVALLSVSSIASADEAKHPLRIGFGGDIGVPSGFALGVVVHPKIDWVSAQLSLTHNTINFGGRMSVKLDPLALLPKVPIGLFADFQGGIAGRGNVPGTTDLPPVGYNYLNFYGGLRLGKPNGFHWNFEVGPSYVVATTKDFQSVLSKSGNLTVSDPTVSAWLIPTFVTGFEVVFP